MPSPESLDTSTSTASNIHPVQIVPSGPPTAPLMLVVDFPRQKDAEVRSPLAGTSRWCLDVALKESGLSHYPTFLTSCLRERPSGDTLESHVPQTLKARTADCQLLNGQWVSPAVRFGRDLLLQEIRLVKPTMVLAMGNLAMWALTGKWGVRKWRSSILQGEVDGHKFKVIPVVHPSEVLREWDIRPAFINDLRRAERELKRGPVVSPVNYAFIIRPNYSDAASKLFDLYQMLEQAWSPVPLGADIETRAGHTACLGIAWSKTEAICIPFMCVERAEGYWSEEEETKLILGIRQILTHPKAKIIWQNGAYDHQYEWRWHFFLPQLGWDTMLAHHAMFSISPKSLDYLSSIYCDQHVYWKEDGKLWDPSIPEDDLWWYNCEDCVRTYEIAEGELEAINALRPSWPRLPEVIQFQHDIQPVIVKMMLRGVRSDEKVRQEMSRALLSSITKIDAEIKALAGCDLNINSPKQMTEFFYDTLNQSPIYSRGPGGTRGGLTCDDEALLRIAGREPVLRPLINRVQALRSGGKFLSTYVNMRRDVDGRLRSSYNVAGTKTYRLSSSTDAFGSGGNLQNIPSGDDEADDPYVLLPNIRKLFLFDEGRIGFDLDGDSADLRIVTGESGCRQMQAYFAAGVKPYVEIAKEFYRDPTITKHHPSYKRMKALCHGSNYGGEPAGLSERIGLPVKDIERMQTWYFGMCPEIAQWQADIRSQCEHRGWIENPFGYRLYRWDRVSRKIFNEFLAWTPQSTVGILINKIAYRIDKEIPEVELLLQVHDSLTGQYSQHLGDPMRRRILALAESVVIPCKSGPITVPAGMKTSTTSWGDCA